MTVKLLTEQHLEFLSLTGGCRGSSKPTLVKMSNCWKSHVAAYFIENPVKQEYKSANYTKNMFEKETNFQNNM